MSPKIFRRSAIAAAALAMAAHAAPAPSAGATTTTTSTTTTTTVTLLNPGTAPALASGIDKAGMDPSVRPQDDLFAAMNGGWIRKTEIPADRPSWGSFIQLRERSDQAVKALVEGLPATHPAAGTDARKLADYYAAYDDVGAIDKAGLAPVAPSLAEIDAIGDTKALLAWMGRWQDLVLLPVNVSVDGDAMDPTTYIAALRQSGLGLTDRDYYLKDDPSFATKRAAYLAYLGKLFALSGDEHAADHAQQVMALERALAEVQWTRADTRDADKGYNPKTPGELAALAPGVDWAAFRAAAQLPAQGRIVVRQPSYLAAFAGLVRSQPLETWKLYLRAHRLDAAALVLPAAFRDASFAFHDQAMHGLAQALPRWQQAIAAMNPVLGEATGRLYVERHFPPAARARAQALVANLMQAYAESIDGLTWMSPATKTAAHEKLSKYMVKIGYPDKWRDYSALDVRAGDALGNQDRGAAFEYRREVSRVGGPVDRTEWGMTPQTVNAYYNRNANEIVFPAAILQPPFFDAAADDAVNYGAIGAVIGHEISHGFDDQGSKFDGDGRLRNWWTDADRKAFDAITGRLVAQYHGYEPLPGHPLDGRLTLGENIADLSGLQISYKAYEHSLAGKPSPVIDGLTGEQRFFLGFAQIYREKTRDERTLESVTTNPHSPGRFRADGTTINADGFHQAFGTKPGDAMWKAPQERIRLW